MTMISPPCSSLLWANLFRSEDASTLGTVEDYAAHPTPWPSPTGAEGGQRHPGGPGEPRRGRDGRRGGREAPGP
jgi:hypothetical protein